MTKIKKEKTGMGMRGKMMLTMSVMSFLVLLVVWWATTTLLQPAYNDHIYKTLDTRLSGFCRLFNTAYEEDHPISGRSLFGLQLDGEFWGEVNDALANGTIKVADTCVDISDTTLRSVNYVENVQPCLLHENSSGRFGGFTSSERDTAAIVALRQEVFEKGEVYRIVESPSGVRQMAVGRLAAGGQYAIIVSMGLARIDEAGAVMGRVLPTLTLLLFALSVVGSWLLSSWLSRPLVRLSAAARKVAAGDYDIHLEERGDDEMALLARDFNHMASEVQHASFMQRQLLANVSHDLRTPLTLIKGYAETVRDITGDDKARRDVQLNIIIDETDRLSGLVNSVMEYTKVSTGTEKPEKVRFDMGDLCEEVAERYQELCGKKGWTFETQLASAQVYADPEMMERVLHNLLGNATHHLGPDGWFALRLLPLPEGGCRVEVEDHGPGISQEDLPKIFERYYRSRSDAGRTGAGLGLSITKAIFQSHAFRFGVNSTPGSGSTFWFIMTDLPAAPAKPEPPKKRLFKKPAPKKPEEK